MKNTNRVTRRQALAGLAALALPAVAEREQRKLRQTTERAWPEGNAPLVGDGEQVWLSLNDEHALLTWEPNPERRLDGFFDELASPEWPLQVIVAGRHTREELIAKLRHAADVLAHDGPLMHDGDRDGGTWLDLQQGKVVGQRFWG